MIKALGEKTLLSAAKRTDYANVVDWNAIAEKLERRPLSCVRRWYVISSYSKYLFKRNVIEDK